MKGEQSPFEIKYMNKKQFRTFPADQPNSIPDTSDVLKQAETDAHASMLKFEKQFESEWEDFLQITNDGDDTLDSVLLKYPLFAEFFKNTCRGFYMTAVKHAVDETTSTFTTFLDRVSKCSE